MKFESMIKQLRKTSKRGDKLWDKRDAALLRVIEIYNSGDGDPSDEMNAALDTLVLAHISAVFHFAG